VILDINRAVKDSLEYQHKQKKQLMHKTRNRPTSLVPDASRARVGVSGGGEAMTLNQPNTKPLLNLILINKTNE